MTFKISQTLCPWKEDQLTEILYLIVDEFNKAETLQGIFRPLSSLIIWLLVFLISEN